MNYRENFSRKIKQLRTSENLTIEEFAKKFNTKKSVVNMWENGNSVPQIELLMKICNCYTILLDSLFKIKERYYFTFGHGHSLQGYAQIVEAETEYEARQMINTYHGRKWAFCYTEERWNSMKADKTRIYPMEIVLTKVLG